jgi:hypothetical protein
MNNLIKKFLMKGDVHFVIIEAFIAYIFIERGYYLVSLLLGLFLFVSLYYKVNYRQINQAAFLRHRERCTASIYQCNHRNAMMRLRASESQKTGTNPLWEQRHIAKKALKRQFLPHLSVRDSLPRKLRK